MSKSNLTDVRIPAYEGNFTYGRSGRNIEKITIHHMAGILSPEQCGQIWQTPGREGSSNYGIGNDGRIGCYVEEENTSWCDSNWDSNCKSITIETSNCEIGSDWKVSDEALNSLIKLVADIAKRYNFGKLVKGQNITWHSMYTATACPGPYLLSKMDYIVDEANKINSQEPQPQTSDVNVYYRVCTEKHGWLSEVRNLNDYAGWENSPIIGVAIGVDKGSVKYRVHELNGNWLPYVTNYDINDYINGYAGSGNKIDCVEVYYFTPDNIRPYKKAKYKINDYDWQHDNEKSNGQDGYAGSFGVPATKFQIVIE